MKPLRKIIALFRKEKLDAEMSEEMRHHLEAQMRRNLAAGMSLQDAHYAAQRSFGGVEQIKERARDQRGVRWLEQLAQDLRFAGRTLRKTPGFTAVVVLSLALGIGANALFFGLLDRALLQPLPVRNPDQLVRFQWQMEPNNGSLKDGYYDAPWLDATSGKPTGTISSSATFEQFHANRALFQEVFAFAPTDRLVLNFDGRIETAYGQIVSGNYHTGLGIAALQGRTLLPDDDRPDAAPVAVISHRFWQRCFAGDPAALGKTISINHASVTVVGILPDHCGDPLESGGYLARDVTLPLAVLRQIDGDGAKKNLSSTWWLRIMARVRPGVTAAQVAANLDGVFQATARDGLGKKDDALALRVVPGNRGFLENRRTNAESLFMPFGLVVLVLLVACGNVATLLLARGSARRREIAVRLALGANRSRIVRQLITESGLLALLGAGLGLLFARWGGAAWGEGDAWQLDGRMLGFTTAVAFFTAIVFGLVPALRATRVDLTAEFQGGSRTLGHEARSWLGRSLVVGQVALSCVLLVLAGLLVRTLHNLRTKDVSFNARNLLLVGVDATFAGYQKAQTPELFARIASRIENLPGVRAATFSTFGQLDGGSFMRGFLRKTEVPAGLSGLVRAHEIAPNYFSTYEIPLVAGRSFTARDVLPGPRVIIINERAAKLYFGAQNPLGRRTVMGEIVGVVRDAKFRDVRSDAEVAYLPVAQSPSVFATFTIRTAGDPVALASSVRKAIAEIEPNLLVLRVRTQAEQIESLLGNERLMAQLATSFGVLALTLACVGLYGLMSYSVQRRTSEIGVRLALGAAPGRVLWMVLRESFTLALIGVALGLAGAAGAVRLVTKMLYGLSPTDVATYAAVFVVLVLVAGLAALLPARRAAKVDPMIALRAE
jgi:predicted permease